MSLHDHSEPTGPGDTSVPAKLSHLQNLDSQVKVFDLIGWGGFASVHKGVLRTVPLWDVSVGSRTPEFMNVAVKFMRSSESNGMKVRFFAIIPAISIYSYLVRSYSFLSARPAIGA